MSDCERPDAVMDGFSGAGCCAATLVYDTRLQPRLAGVGMPRHSPLGLLYVAGGLELELWFKGSSLSGTVRGDGGHAVPDLASTRVVVDGVSGRLEAGMDEWGRFALEGLVHGPHRLELHLGRELASCVDCDLVEVSYLLLTTPPAGSLAQARDCVTILEAAIRDTEVRAAAEGSSVDALLTREREQVSGRVPTLEQQVTYLRQGLDRWRGRVAALEAQERP